MSPIGNLIGLAEVHEWQHSRRHRAASEASSASSPRWGAGYAKEFSESDDRASRPSARIPRLVSPR
jgi:hypothetical protein